MDAEMVHYVDMRFADHDRAADAAYRAMDARLQGANEVRAQMSTLLPRTEYTGRHADLQNQINAQADTINAMGAQVAALTGRSAGTQYVWGLVLALTAIAVTLAALLISR